MGCDSSSKKNYLRFEGEKHANGMPGFQKSIQQLARASRGAAGNSEAFKDSKDFKKQVYYLDVQLEAPASKVMFYISIIGWELIYEPKERDLRVMITD